MTNSNQTKIVHSDGGSLVHSIEMPPRKKKPTISKGIPVRTTNRDKRFPVFYKVQEHPLDPEPQTHKHIFVFEQDTSVQGNQDLHDFETSLETPLGRTETMASRGEP